MNRVIKIRVLLMFGFSVLVIFGYLIAYITSYSFHSESYKSTKMDLSLLNDVNVKLKRDIFNVSKLGTGASKALPRKASNNRFIIPKIKAQFSPIDGLIYVGYLKRSGKNMAFILDKDKMIVAKVGDMIESRLRITSISNEKIKFSYEPAGEVYVLEMNGGTENAHK